MQYNFLTATNFTAAREGLYQRARADDGNWTGGRVGSGRLVGTMRGISAPVMVRWLGDESLVTTATMQAIDEATYRAIARALYWRALNADFLPGGLDLMLFDFGFNAGISRSARIFQQIIGLSSARLDGDIGPATLQYMDNAALDTICTAIAPAYARQLQQVLGVAEDGVIGDGTVAALKAADNGRTRAMLYALASRQDLAYRSFQSFRINGAGWLNRLSARLEAALALASGGMPRV